jgi:hypothetical protein
MYKVLIRKQNHTLVKFIVYLLLIVTLPTLFSSRGVVKNESKTLVKQLETIQPDYVFIGNSMLDSRIDDSYFEGITEKKCFLIWRGGVVSSFWYLILKNVISVSTIKPEHVFIFFRNTFLTEPLYRTDEEYKKILAEYKTESEMIFDSIENYKSTKWDKKLRLTISGLYTFSEISEKARKAIPKISEKLTGLISKQFSSDFNRSDVNRIFQINNFRPTENDGENISKYPWNYSFQNAIEHSFLPHMIDLMKKTKLKYSFIRVQKRPGQPLPIQDKLRLNKYMEDLRLYLNKHGYQLYDFTNHPEVTLDMYGAGDHINGVSKQKYTYLFIKAMEEMQL